MWINYQGRSTGSNFASPVAAIHFGTSPIATLASFTHWMETSGFATRNTAPDALWHHLPIFCGWGEQTTIAGAQGKPSIANTLATQANYTQWIDDLEARNVHPATIVIDDKWMTKYGTLDIDTAKWPDLKRFVDEQHAHGRHVLLWIPVASTEGLPKELAIARNGNAVVADVSNPAYEAFLRKQIHHLVADIGIDGFKEDWVGSQGNFSNVTQSQPLYGIEFVRRFQFILFDEAHRTKPDALIETQTPNPLFRESSDMLRLNDIYTGTRNVPAVMRNRAAIARAAGWSLLDTDNAATTTLAEWWSYMRAQPSIGVPSLYIVSRTVVTHEPVPAEDWQRLATLWQQYTATQKAAQYRKPLK